ncbi:hypothetical protein IFT73_14450 [Aeromicrobium sp. CFBP 8757]|uniref:hypothetical protein n=1 Tax=Aeromicrobium sp. CFBP 8757 TaxID=2775288 RepID=UPI00177C26B2|nr:hypothetical protein [Aeromicrobium sp. CFBP 8757]MBD8608055.1 hypothetical protein [Aeromicrobium sp. CFBP 8757]
MILLVLVAAALVPVAAGWTGRHRVVAAAVATVLLAAAVIVRVVASISVDQGVLGIVASVLAVAGGSVVTTAVFDVIDDRSTDRTESLEAAGHILRGGTWVGALERLAVFGSLVAGMPSGVALTLAVKGLGRYPELRSGDRPATAERFIIGTLVSVLWAALCAYVATGFAPLDAGRAAFDA